jgi:hypothetical protein
MKPIWVIGAAVLVLIGLGMAQDFSASMNLSSHLCTVALDGSNYTHQMNMLIHSPIVWW